MKARLAKRADADVVFRLLREFAQYENKPPPNEAACVRLLADGWGRRRLFEAWLADIDDKSVGLATVYPIYSTFKGQADLFIADLFVTAGYRNRGIGTSLLNAIIRDAPARGYSRLIWECPSNSQANALYQKFMTNREADWRYWIEVG
jgi:GNAT superfamily N-acetyltransferase